MRYPMSENGGDRSDRPAKRIRIVKDGPYIVTGWVPLAKEYIVRDKDGVPKEWKRGSKYPVSETYALCRCGESSTKPFCDGTHAKIKFDGTEVAIRDDYLSNAGFIEGPEIDMNDNRDLCAGQQFCHRAGGVWDLVAKSEPNAKDLVVEITGQCPTGRLVARCKDGNDIEPALQKEIALTEDPYRRVSGPLWVKGAIPIFSADGSQYEPRNRVTLCRCGHSENMPLCDGTHINEGFKDGDDAITGSRPVTRRSNEEK
jgi:CDGSH-type Zn-finger protein